MTRKDYVAIAAALAATRPDMPACDCWECQKVGDQWRSDRDAIADALEADNPNHFRRDVFIIAATTTPGDHS